MYHIIGRCYSVQQRRNTCWTHSSIYLSLYMDTCINVYVYTTLLAEAVLSNNGATPCEHTYNNISPSIYMYIHTTSAKAVLYDSDANLREHIHTWIYISLSVHTCIYIYTTSAEAVLSWNGETPGAHTHLLSLTANEYLNIYTYHISRSYSVRQGRNTRRGTSIRPRCHDQQLLKKLWIRVKGFDSHS